MTDISMILSGFRPPDNDKRVVLKIDPSVRTRLHRLLCDNPELMGVGYSAFIDRACELAETAIAESRR